MSINGLYHFLAVFCVFSLALVGGDFIDSVPNGDYAGVGSWQDNFGNTGEYQAYAEFQSNHLRQDYAWGQASLTMGFMLQFYAPGKFEVMKEAETIGRGICELNHCQYVVEFNSDRYAESIYYFTSVDGTPYLLKVGQKKVGNREVNWREKLDKLDIH